MIVAAGAADRQTEEHLARNVGDVVEDFLAALLQIGGVVLVGPQTQEAGGDEGIGVVRLQLVAGQLLPHEAIVGQVGVEAPG